MEAVRFRCGLSFGSGFDGSSFCSAGRFLKRNVTEYVYPNGFIRRRVNNSDDISWYKGRVFISEVFRFEELGFEEVEDGFYNVFFREVEIGVFDAEALRFRPVPTATLSR